MHSGPARHTIAVVVASLACAAIAPASALGAIGDLTFTGCVGDLSGCTATTPKDAVENPSSVAVSADGTSVYATANNVVDWFSRNTSTGELTFKGCYGADADAGCTATNPASAIDGPNAVAVSPDGKSVYVASLDNGTIDEFSRSVNTGALTFTGCLGSGNCPSTSVAPDALDGASSVAVSPNNETVYVTGSISNAVSWLSRATSGNSTGALTFEGCIADHLTGCTTPSPANAVDDPGSVALSADGENAYVASFGSFANDSNGVLSTFSISAQSGALTFTGCVGDDPGATGCTATTPADALDGASAVAVSPDGHTVYAAAQTSGVLDWFSRNPNSSGALGFMGCYGNDPDAGCTATPSGDVSPFSLSLSSDGNSVYAVTQSPGMVDVFARNPENSSAPGALTFVSCIGDDSAGANCMTTSPADALDGADSAVVTPDGQNVYATGGIVSGSGAIDEFSRVTLFCENVASDVAYQTPTPLQLNCSGPPSTQLTYTIVSQPAHGTLSNPSNSGQLTYTPDNGYSGGDSFTYKASDASGSSNTATVMLTVSGPPPPPPPPPPPSSVAFTISPDTDPVLSLQMLTFAVTDPSPGVTYQWDFGDTDSPTGSATAPFVVQATGATVTYRYPNPPTPPANPTVACATVAGCPGNAAVYTVRVQALTPGNATVSATPQNLVVVPVQPPTASFQVLQTGPSTAVTQPVTIVPQAALPESQSGVQDYIALEDFWFNLAPGQSPTGPPDLVCVPDGACGQYSGSAPIPSAAQLTPEPGEDNLGTAPITVAPGMSCDLSRPSIRARPAKSVRARPGKSIRARIAKCGAATTVAPTGGFEAFSMNFWDAALANIGSPGDAIPTLAQLDSGIQIGPFPQLQNGYPPLASVPLDKVDGYYGEQGIVAPDCFPGYPDTPYEGYSATPNPWFDNFPGTQCDLDSYAGIQNDNYPWGSYDVANFGVNSVPQLEDQFNFLYNYATVVGVDTDLNDKFGPATGASPGPNNTTVPRTVTMIAYDSEGVPSAPQTENVPLTPATNPTLQVCVKDISISGSLCQNPAKKAPFVISDKDTLQLVTTGSSGGTDPILYYAVQVGQPNVVLRTIYTGSNLSCPAQNPPSGGFKWPGTPPTTGHQSPFPVPAFSDLEAGAFPWHNCGAYEERTVDSNLAPGPLPTSGPNVPVRPTTSIRRRAALRPRGGSASGYTAPNTGVANPVLITTNPDGLDFTFGSTSQSPSGFGTLDYGYGSGPGIYSVAVAAYDTSGLGAITRIDGFEAQPPVKGGQCLTVQSQPITITDAHAKGSDTSQLLGFSGGCVTIVVTPTGDVLMYASTAPVDFDGVPLVAAPGYEIVVYYPNRSIQDVYVVKAGHGGCSIKNTVLKGPTDVPHGCKPPSSSKAGSIYLAPGPGGYTTPPGIGLVRHFDAAQADSWLGARVVGGLPLVGSLAAAKKGTPMAVKGCGMYGPDSQPWPIPTGALYNGFSVVTQPCVSFTRDNSKGGNNPNNGDSRIAFWDSLPQGFGPSGKPPPSQVVLQGMDRPAVSFLSTNAYGNVARTRRAHRVLDGSPASFAEATAPSDPSRRPRDLTDLPGFPPIPSCPAASKGGGFPPNGKSGLAIPDGTDMGPLSGAGPLSLPEGASFCYDSALGDFIGSVMMTVPGPLEFSAKVGFEIGHGRLIDAGGEVSGNPGIPIGPIFVNDLKFDIQTEPVEVAGAIEASIVDVLDVDAGVFFKPSVPEVDFEGNVGIAGFEFGNFAIDFDKDTVGMHVTIGKDFGPASVNIFVRGAMIFHPFAFYLEGGGSACLFICLEVDGLISNEGFAACGSINLVLFSFSGGFAVLWSGPNSGVHLFVGCNLQPYIPAALQNVMGATRSHALPQTLYPPGTPGNPPTSAQVTLHQSGDCTPTVTTKCTNRVVAVQVHSLLSQEAPGQTPEVTLTGPSGDSRVLQTPTTPGYYGFYADAGISGGTQGGSTDEGEGLVEQDPAPIYDTDSMSSAYCPTSSTNVPLSSTGVNTGRLSATSAACPRVTTTTLFVPNPAPGLWTLSVESGSPPVVDVETAISEPPLRASQFHGGVHTATVKPVCAYSPIVRAKICNQFTLHTDGRTFSSSKSQVMLAPSVQTTGTTKSQSLGTGKGSVLDVPTIDDARLRAIVLKAPAGFQGTIALMDHGPTVDQVIIPAITPSEIPAGGLAILFEPTPDFGANHQVKAFLSNSQGMPDQMLVLSSFTSPPLPQPGKPKIVKVQRNGPNVDVYFDPGDDPIANGIGLTLSQANGLRFEDAFTGSALHPIGPPVEGIGLARQASEYMVTIPDVDPTENVSVAITGSNLGRLGVTAVRRSITASIPSVSESSLLTSLK